jgi:Phage integrase, N-terminal SAM-like domain
MPVTESSSWTVVDDEGLPVAPVEAFLSHLTALERSPETVRAYALSLKLWLEFLVRVGVGWDEAGPEDVSRFVAWLRSPADNVVVLDGGTASLPNGYCGRPPQQDCPHPNACLTCPDFQTTVEFLDIHRAQAGRNRVLIAQAEADGRQRLAANHRRVQESLDRIIGAFERLGETDRGQG